MKHTQWHTQWHTYKQRDTYIHSMTHRMTHTMTHMHTPIQADRLTHRWYAKNDTQNGTHMHTEWNIHTH